jgi:FAD/FMN-containing dehydrogenase
MIGETALETFEAKLRGDLLRPDSEGYEEARALWNAMIDMKPALIARSTGVADVIDAVKFARQNRLAVAVRGGGHNVACEYRPRFQAVLSPVVESFRAEPGAAAT